jgi:hypothetical protein
MTRELFYTLFLGAVVLVVAWFLVQRFVTPWLNSEDRSIPGRVQNVIQSIHDRKQQKETLFGSRKRTFIVSVTHIVGLIALLLLVSKVSAWFLLYPVIGFAVLRAFRVAPDRQLRPDASPLQRFEARAYQAWSWPIVVVVLLSRKRSR